MNKKQTGVVLMNNKNKLAMSLFVFSLASLFAVASKAHAEYYLVYPGGALYTECGNGCSRPCQAAFSCQIPVYYFHYVSPHRHYHEGTGEMAEYKWITAP
jgi:hypothetical protein